MRKLLLFLLLLAAISSPAQELNCDVTINLEGIPGGLRDNLRDFEQQVEKYLNGTRWTDEDFMGDRISCTMSIFFTGATQDNKYTAKVFVASSRPIYDAHENKSGQSTPVLRIIDEKWEFEYIRGKSMLHDDYSFDAFTDFFDFYAYIICGYDLETYNDLAGAKYFRKAQDLVSQASTSQSAVEWTAQKGSYSRFSLIDEILNFKFDPFRRAFTKYHYDGLDNLAGDPHKGLDAMLSAVESIGQVRDKQSPRSIVIKTFFDTKATELAEQFSKYVWGDAYARLTAADPSHASLYDEYKNRQAGR